jgi:hypothetical protein
VTDPRARRGLPDRWLLPPPPREPALAARFEDAPFDHRRALARVGPDEVTDLSEQDLEVVAGLARARLATSWRLLATAPLLGWLVLMTVWGFGRSTYPEVVDRYLLAGLALGAIAWLLAAIGAARRLRRARQVLAACDESG